MPDRLFEEPQLATLYDLFAPPSRRRDFAFYLPMVMSASSALDVGCGTGALLTMAREQGHKGRLCGIDPAHGMLEHARERSDIDWVLGDPASMAWKDEFDLIVMTGHAFQVFIGDDELHASLLAIRAALKKDGRFAFETRNPADRAWERWHEEYTLDAVDATGNRFRMECAVETPVEGGYVRFSHTFSNPGWPQPQVSWSTLRFLDAAELGGFLEKAGFVIEQRFGDWDRSPLTDTSPEIITVARGA